MMYKFGIFEKQKISFKTETLPFDIKTKMTNGIYVLVFRESRKQKIDLQFLKDFGNFQKIDAPIQGGLDYSQVLHALLCKYQSSSGKKSWVFECIGWCSIAAKKVKEKSLLKLVFPFLHPTFCNRICRKIVVVGSVSVMKDQRNTRYTHIPCRKNIVQLVHMYPHLLCFSNCCESM